MVKSENSPPHLSSLSLEDQQWINNNLSPDNGIMSNVNDNVNGGCKQRVNTELTFSKRSVIDKIGRMNYRTPAKKIANFLDFIFKDCENVKEGHWLYIAQNWNPRAIKRVLYDMRKQHLRGDMTIKNPAAYFTFLIKKRKRRKT